MLLKTLYRRGSLGRLPRHFDLVLISQISCGGVEELGHSLDLKSSVERHCGFESHLPQLRKHMPYKDLNRQREYQRCWMAERRKQYLADKRCICGSVDRLEVHHVDPRKKVSHRIWSWSAGRRFRELQKCIVLCYACHLERTRKQLQKPIRHGTNNGYCNPYGCRCIACKRAHAAYQRKYLMRQ